MLITRPHRRRPRANAYQSPRAAIHTPTSSPHVAAATRTESERKEAIRVEEPDTEEKQRDRQRQGMEAVHRHPGHPRVCEIRQREQGGVPLGAEVPAPEPEHRESTQRNRDDLDGDERQRRRSDDPEGSQRGEDRVDVLPDARQLLARDAVRDLEHMAVRSAPDGLGHVSEVVSCKPEVLEEITHRGEQHDRPDEHRDPHGDGPGVRAHGRHCGRGHALRRERRHPTHGLTRRNT